MTLLFLQKKINILNKNEFEEALPKSPPSAFR